MSHKVEKPEHNKQDDIFELRQSIKNWDDKIANILIGSIPRSPRVVCRAAIHYDVEAFARRIRYGNFRVPVIKILMPELDLKTSVIYYVLQGTDGVNHIFRGTSGYAGTGASESALVEEMLSRIGYPVELRSGDHLLSFIE